MESAKLDLKTYKQLQIMGILYNNCLSTLQWPSFILCNLSCHGLCIYILVKLLHALHPAIGIVYGSWAFIWIILDFVMFPHMGKMKELSQDYLHCLSVNQRGKLEKVTLRSLRPLGVNVGNFFTMNKTTALTIIVIVSNLTINALLLI